MGGLFPGGNFLGGIFPGGFFPGGIFPDTPMTTRKSTLKILCAVRSERHIDILSAKSIGKEHLTSSSRSHLSKRLFLFVIQ